MKQIIITLNDDGNVTVDWGECTTTEVMGMIHTARILLEAFLANNIIQPKEEEV